MGTHRPSAVRDADTVTGWLDVGDGHRVHFEDHGPRDGPVALLLHGGPGSSSTARQREWLDAGRWRIVQFDQRGCGLSTPLGGIGHNHTDALVADIERLRTHLRVERWMVAAGSWGAALALVYASRHRAAVAALVLRGVFLASRADVAWFFHGAGTAAPDAHGALMATIPRRWRGDPLPYLALRLCAADGAGTGGARRRAMRAAALALACQHYESALDGAPAPAPGASALPRLVARYRVQMHYLVHGCFLDEGAVLRAAATLGRVPVAIVHGEHDRTCRPANARALRRACPSSRLAWAMGAGHTPFHPATTALLRDAGACLLRDGHLDAWPARAASAGTERLP